MYQVVVNILLKMFILLKKDKHNRRECENRRSETTLLNFYYKFYKIFDNLSQNKTKQDQSNNQSTIKIC